MKFKKINSLQIRTFFYQLKNVLKTSLSKIRQLRTQYNALEKPYKRALLIVIAVIFLNLLIRMYGYIEAKYRSEAASHVVVNVVSPSSGGAESSLSFPGRLEAYLNAPIYSRVNGYLKKWNLDIGSEVKKGQVLGEIEAPEVDQQLQQAKSDLISAKSAESLAKISYQRWKNLLEMNAVSKQEYDQKATEYEAKKSLRQIAEANLEKAKSFSGYKSIPAPFSGIVTERNTDVGALVTAGSGKPLFNISNIDKLRVFLNIPQIFKNDISPGVPAKITVPEFPDKIFEAKVIRSSGAINESSGSILVEIELDNPDHVLTAGEFARVNVDIPSDRSIPRIPSSALIIRKNGVFIATADKTNQVELIKVEIGRDFGQEVEVIGPIDNTTRVINNPPDTLIDRQVIEVAKQSLTPNKGK